MGSFQHVWRCVSMALTETAWLVVLGNRQESPMGPTRPIPDDESTKDYLPISRIPGFSISMESQSLDTYATSLGKDLSFIEPPTWWLLPVFNHIVQNRPMSASIHEKTGERHGLFPVICPPPKLHIPRPAPMTFPVVHAYITLHAPRRNHSCDMMPTMDGLEREGKSYGTQMVAPAH